VVRAARNLSEVPLAVVAEVELCHAHVPAEKRPFPGRFQLAALCIEREGTQRLSAGREADLIARDVEISHAALLQITSAAGHGIDAKAENRRCVRRFGCDLSALGRA